MRILIADDEPEMTRVLEALLKRERCSVDVVHNGQDALDYALAENYDCLILDIMMPKLDGIQVLQALRGKQVAAPVLLLTAKSQVEDRVAGLDSGADDYLPKPFDSRELIARVRALTRRGGAYTPGVLTAGNVTLDRSTFELKCGAAPFPRSSSWSIFGAMTARRRSTWSGLIFPISGESWRRWGRASGSLSGGGRGIC